MLKEQGWHVAPEGFPKRVELGFPSVLGWRWGRGSLAKDGGKCWSYCPRVPAALPAQLRSVPN